MRRERLNITLSPRTLDQLDQVTDNRSRFIEDAIWQKINGFVVTLSPGVQDRIRYHANLAGLTPQDWLLQLILSQGEITT